MNIKHVIRTVILSISMSCLITGCGAKNMSKASTIANIEDKIIYIQEDGRLVPFIVADVKYQNGITALLRRDVLPELRAFDDSDSSYYKDSDIDVYLSHEYISKLDEKTYKHLANADVTITADSAIGLTGDETEKIKRCVFLPAYTELGFKKSPTVTDEGKTFAYFKSSNDRTALSETTGMTESYFMRSPNTYHTSAVYYLDYDGIIGYGNGYDLSGIRPVVCVYSNTLVEEYNDAGKTAYIIKE